MDKVIQTIIREDLTGQEIGSLIHGIASVKTYDQLQGVSDIRQFLQPHDKVALFFPVSPGSSTPGHWLAIWYDQKSNTLHHFDSYGFSPDAELKYSTNPLVKDQLLNRLYSRAQQSGLKVVWNTYPYQKQGSNVNTCGRHVICRIRFSYMPDQMYHTLMSGQKMDPDSLVTLLTLLALDEDQHDVGQIMKSV